MVAEHSISIPLRSGWGCYSDSLTQTDIDTIRNANSVEDLAKFTSLGARLKNWFCRTDKSKAAIALFHLNKGTSGQAMSSYLAELQDYSADHAKVVFESKTNNGLKAKVIIRITEHNQDHTYDLTNEKSWAIEEIQAHNIQAPLSQDEHQSLLPSAPNVTKTPKIWRPSDSRHRSNVEGDKHKQRWIKFTLHDIPMPGAFFGSSYRRSKVLAFDEAKREGRHDFIQLLFPSTEHSAHYHKAPMLTQAMVLEIQNNRQLQEQILNNFNFILNHWGVKLIGSRDFISTDNGDKVRQKLCCSNFDHNMQRATRVLTFLKQSGFEEAAHYFNLFLQGKGPSDSRALIEAKAHWNDAVNKPNLGCKQLRFNA